MAEARTGPDDVDLSAADRAEIDGMYLRLASSSYYELLGVEPGADRRSIRDAYFGLSQRFHPDAWFGRNLGLWKSRMEEIFRESRARTDVLSHKKHRADYDASRGYKPASPSAGPAHRAQCQSSESHSSPALRPGADPKPPVVGESGARPAAAKSAQFAPEERGPLASCDWLARLGGL